MINAARITIFSAAALLAGMPVSALAGEVQIYIDGYPHVYQVPDELEMYELEPVLILEDNRALLQEYCLQCPQSATVGIGNQSWDRGLDDRSNYLGEREIQPYIRDIRYRDYLSSTEWNELWGNVNYSGRMRLDLDHSGPLWSYDGSYMHHEGTSFGPDGRNDEEELLLGHKDRTQYSFTLRNGGMDGGHQFLRGQWYKVRTDEMPFQPVDVEHLRIGAGFRMVECPGMLQAEIFSGYYKSDRQAMDNTYSGVQADGYLYLDDAWTVDAAASTTDYDLKLQNGSATRSESSAALSYDLSDEWSVSAGLDAYRDDSDISAVSDTRSYTERSARLDYNAGGRASASLTLSRREVDYERLMMENNDLYQLNLRDPELSRADLAEFRIDEQADYDSLRLRSNIRLDSCSRLSADFRRDDYGTLPGSGDFATLTVQPSYFANERSWGSLFYERSFANGGRMQINASEQSRENDVRDSRYCSRRYSVSYGDMISCCSRWSASIGRSETDLDGSGVDIIWDSSSTDYGLDFSGYGAWASYRFSLAHHVREGSASGDYNSVGLELDLNDSPVVLSTWWREQQAGLSPLAFSDDIGLSLGWNIQF
ncbi:hypothetical protein KDL44_15700 [bacterium]|nr:hypothetical protein [bacterium]